LTEVSSLPMHLSSIIYILRITYSEICGIQMASILARKSAHRLLSNQQSPCIALLERIALRRRGRAAEGTRLLNEHTPKGYRGFEPLRLRHFPFYFILSPKAAVNRCLLQIESFADRFPALKARMEKLGFAYVETIDFDHYFVKDRI
jgi:hypothetical protein